MRALTIADDRRLVVAEVPDPEPGPGEVLVRVRAAGLNRADLAQRAGRYPAPPGSPADVPGLEFAGEVVAHGDGTSAPAAGSRVFGITGGGGQAELLVVPAPQCAPVPDALDDVVAGGVPEAFVTAHDALVTQAGFESGETVLVHAVGSGVGTSALQLARAAGCTTVGTARTEAKLTQARALGLDHAVLVPRDVDPAALADEIVEAAGPVDVVVDLVGGPYLEADVRAARTGARIVMISTLAGGRATLDIGTAMGKRLRVFGTVLRARTPAQKADATAAFTRDVVPLLASGAATPVIARTFPLGEADAAYDLLADDAVFGKIVLDLG